MILDPVRNEEFIGFTMMYTLLFVYKLYSIRNLAPIRKRHERVFFNFIWFHANKICLVFQKCSKIEHKVHHKSLLWCHKNFKSP